jgi:hypothetical protein
MPTKKTTLFTMYIAIFVQIAAYVAHDTGRLNEGRLYWLLLYAASFTLLVAAVWLFRLQSHSEHRGGTQ